jgi:hypothetical protein
MDQRTNGLGLQVLLGIIGFFLAGGLSLAAGNTILTSVMRGAIGIVVLFLLGWLLQFALRTFVGDPVAAEAGDDRGMQIDIMLPEESPDGMQPVRSPEDPSEFVPLYQSLQQTANEGEGLSEDGARRLAEALRHLSD